MPYTDQGLPFAPRSHTSYQAAVKVARTRGPKTQAYLDLLATGSYADFEAVEALKRWKLPISSICSIRNGVKDQLVKDGTTTSPYGMTVDRWRLAT